MTTPTTLAIIGAGLAGAKAAEAARAAGYEGRIALIGDEASPPYERPPLSKAVLRGEAEPQSAFVHPEGYYADHDIELVADAAIAVDVAARRVTLSSGDGIGFEAAVFTTGAEPRRLDIPGADLAGIHYLRTVGDALRLRDAIRSASRVAVIGAGWIGSEVAASARQMGTDVVLVDQGAAPLERVVGGAIGEIFRRLHADHGVELRLGTGVTEIRGSKTVEEVVLADGRTEPADVVVAGVGVAPRTALAANAGITVSDGILVDERLETGVPGIFAAGDVASAWHPRYRRRLRVEHWANALNQGVTAGGNAAGKRDVYERLPYFYSDQYDLGLEYAGHGRIGDAVVVRGDLGSRRFVAFWHRDGVVSAAMSVNVWDVMDDLNEIVLAGRPVDVARLADEQVPLDGFARE